MFLKNNIMLPWLKIVCYNIIKIQMIIISGVRVDLSRITVYDSYM